MIGTTLSFCPQLWPSPLIQVESDLLPGYFQIQIVGLGDSSVRECRERIRSAIQNSGYMFPMRHVVINLAPHDQKKSGTIMELAMAASLLISSGQLSAEPFQDTLLLGSLGLNGNLTSCPGLEAGIYLAARNPQINRVIVPAQNTSSLPKLDGVKVYAAESLRDLLKFEKELLPEIEVRIKSQSQLPAEIDMADIFGLDHCKLGLAAAITGRHHMLIMGEPGTGKTLLSKAAKGILPPLEDEDVLTVSEIHALNGTQLNLMNTPPFRSPHHSASSSAIIGGGRIPGPGEVTLAHRGVLFLDELIEFKHDVLQTLREPMEDKRITVSRVAGKAEFPADFILLAASNPCRCGYLWSLKKSCSCSSKTTANLHQKLIGPLLDRFSIGIESCQTSNDLKYSSKEWQTLIINAKSHMLKRNSGLPNSQLNWQQLEKIWHGPGTLKGSLIQKTRALQLSHRSQLNTARAALSLADVKGESHLQGETLDEFLHYRLVHSLLG